MNRMVLLMSAAFSLSGVLLVDSAVKGTALLLVAAIASLVLIRDSAAVRHLVWLLAVVSTLAVPVLSATLPEWRALPEWARMPSSIPLADGVSSGPVEPVDDAHIVPAASEATSQDVATAEPTVAVAADQPAIPTAGPRVPWIDWTWREALPVLWLMGFSLLGLRQLAARWMLWSTQRQARVLWPNRSDASAANDPLVQSLLAMSARLGVRGPVTLLVHPDNPIPIVWGLFRSRLLLPAAARQWSHEQLQSVLLHELAHLRRRDTWSLLVTQLACALHWFNPLIWVASWRLSVERERACDDLVLACGVRPSAYAGHLLEIASQLALGPWTSSCALAMARSSSLESRLVAVLCGKQNRRRETLALAGIGLVIATGLAIPVAMLRAADAKSVSGAQADSKPIEGTKLPQGMEDRLQWGDAAHGLRLALIRPQAVGEPALEEIFDFKLVIQNVSDAPIRFRSTPGESKRSLRFYRDGEVLAGMVDPEARLGDMLLQPQQVTIVPLFSRTNTGRSVSSDPSLSFVAKLGVESSPDAGWNETLATAESFGMGVTHGLVPKDKSARSLLKSWTAISRDNGSIPGAMIGRLGDSVKTFIKNNPTWETTPRLKEMLPRFDASHDWAGSNALALLDELASIQETPVSMALDHESETSVRRGSPLPASLVGAPWGEPAVNGLRLAWLLEPRSEQHRLGSPLKARILIQNTGKTTVAFRTRTWHQVSHTAREAGGKDLKVDSTYWTTLGRLLPYRLAPGEFVELNGPGIGIGANKNDEDWLNTRVGSWIETKAGDVVTVSTESVQLFDWNQDPAADPQSKWWLEFITARLSRHLPLPDDAEERRRIVYRVAMELYGTPVGTEINATFVADRTPTAVGALAKALAADPLTTPYAGSLKSGSTKFKVLPVDPDAAKRPRVANNPGRYTIADTIRLDVQRRPLGDRIVNEAYLQFYAADQNATPPGKPHHLKLPDGYDTWAAAWHRGGTMLWLQQASGVRTYDFADPANVKETDVSVDQVPADVQAVLKGLIGPATPKRGSGPPAAAPQR